MVTKIYQKYNKIYKVYIIDILKYKMFMQMAESNNDKFTKAARN